MMFSTRVQRPSMYRHSLQQVDKVKYEGSEAKWPKYGHMVQQVGNDEYGFGNRASLV